MMTMSSLVRVVVGAIASISIVANEVVVGAEEAPGITNQALGLAFLAGPLEKFETI